MNLLYPMANFLGRALNHCGASIAYFHEELDWLQGMTLMEILCVILASKKPTREGPGVESAGTCQVVDNSEQVPSRSIFVSKC